MINSYCRATHALCFDVEAHPSPIKERSKGRVIIHLPSSVMLSSESTFVPKRKMAQFWYHLRKLETGAVCFHYYYTNNKCPYYYSPYLDYYLKISFSSVFRVGFCWLSCMHGVDSSWRVNNRCLTAGASGAPLTHLIRTPTQTCGRNIWVS